MKKFNTLDAEATALTFESARLVDARDAGDPTAAAKLDVARAKLYALNAEMKARTYYVGRKLCHR